jgi:hypothetical protein
MAVNTVPFFADWQFWSFVLASIAVILSQLPPVRLWFKPRRVEVEVHSRLLVTHKVGNPNLGVYLGIRNTGGRELRVSSVAVSVSRDGRLLSTLPAQNFFETASSQNTSLFVPFSLRPGDSWSHLVNFLHLFDRTTEKLFRESVSAMSADIREKLELRPESDKALVKAKPELVKPFTDMFGNMFIWTPGEYVIELVVTTDPSTAAFRRSYRFTLYESDSAELKSHTDDYPFGAGLTYSVERHTGVLVPLSPHGG